MGKKVDLDKFCPKKPNHKRCRNWTFKSPTASKIHESMGDIFNDLDLFDLTPKITPNADYEDYLDEQDQSDNQDNDQNDPNTKITSSTKSPPTLNPTTTVYNPAKNYKNNKFLQGNEATRMNIGPVSFELNGWIVLVACMGFSMIFVTLVWKVTSRICDNYETKALRPPTTIARITGENENHDDRRRRRRKRARRRGETDNLHRDIVMNVPIESLSRMVRLQQQQLPGIQTNRNMPQLMELTTIDPNTLNNNQNQAQSHQNANNHNNHHQARNNNSRAVTPTHLQNTIPSTSHQINNANLAPMTIANTQTLQSTNTVMTTLGGAIPPAGNPNMIHNNNHSNNITPNYPQVQINPITGMSQPIYSNAPNLQSPQIQNNNQVQSHRPVQDEVSLPGYSQAVPTNDEQPQGQQSIDDNEGDTNISGHRVGLPSSDQE